MVRKGPITLFLKQGRQAYATDSNKVALIYSILTSLIFVLNYLVK